MQPTVGPSQPVICFITKGEYSLQQLDDVNLRKLEKLTKDAPDCADAVRWIRQNRDKFKMEVLEPPVLSLNIPDKKYAKAIEACFSKNQLRVRCPNSDVGEVP